MNPTKVDPLMADFIQGTFEREFRKYLCTVPTIDEVISYIVNVQRSEKIFSGNLKHVNIDGGVLLLIDVIDFQGFTFRIKVPYSEKAYKKSTLYDIDNMLKNTEKYSKINVEEEVRELLNG